jgi:glycosyltransferase involved in cell wall biosynthesis
MTTIADMQSRWGPDRPPVALYVHETQLTYPVPKGESVDMHLAFTDIQNLIAAEHVRFNSQTHLSAFLDNTREFLRKMPKPRLSWVPGEIARRSGVLYPGISVPSGGAAATLQEPKDPLIIWNHRWEFDKAPEVFFDALREVKRQGISFSLAILGENFQAHPAVFEQARDTFADEIVQFGFADDRAAYEAWLRRGQIVVSTAIQENFGISVLEAIAAGCFPLLPYRLSYPEIIPERFHDRVLYRGREELVWRLRELLTDREERAMSSALQDHARSFSWEQRIVEWDTWLGEAAAGAGNA